MLRLYAASRRREPDRLPGLVVAADRLPDTA